MRLRSLSSKLIAAFLMVAFTGAMLVALVAGVITITQFDEYRADQDQSGMISVLENYYASQGSWQGVEQVLPFLGRDPNRDDRNNSPTAILLDENGRVVSGAPDGGNDRITRQMMQQAIDIEVDGQVVGFVIFNRRTGPVDIVAQARAAAERIFLVRVGQGFLIGVLGGTAVALIIGIWLARTLTRPVREMTAATQAIATGQLNQTVPVRSQDELGELAASINQMSADLAHSQNLRRQMTADIAHDLRTPLSVILGHAEALSEGVLPPDPETFRVLHDEATRLQRLVDDLRTLSLAEAGELSLARRPVDPRALLERAWAAHSPRAQQQEIALSLDAAQNLPDVDVDPDRLGQVLDNLLSNALRHTPNGGQIRLAATAFPDHVQLSVADSGSGIAAADLPNIFARFYRGDRSRQRQEGSTGLGLAIAKSVVVAHNGRIWAESPPDSGAIFYVTLPLAAA